MGVRITNKGLAFSYEDIEDELMVEVQFDSFSEMEDLADWLRAQADSAESLTVRLAAQKVIEALDANGW